jgi:hypothetical protein
LEKILFLVQGDYWLKALQKLFFSAQLVIFPQREKYEAID